MGGGRAGESEKPPYRGGRNRRLKRRKRFAIVSYTIRGSVS